MERIELLVTVKAYPNISAKYGEVVCVAGIRLDIEPKKWVRLFPIPFRDLEFSKRFHKYQVIHLDADPHGTDQRPESMRPNTDSLRLGRRIKTRSKWRERRAIVEPLSIGSMCQLQRRQSADGTSLGLFKPAQVIDLLVDEESSEWDPDKQGIVYQPSLLFPGKSALEKIPWRFRYQYLCADSSCESHRQSIIDWELAEAARTWPNRYGPDGALERIRQRWLGEMCGPDKDTYFFAGNMHRFPDRFLILGVFWPPKLEVAN